MPQNSKKYDDRFDPLEWDGMGRYIGPPKKRRGQLTRTREEMQGEYVSPSRGNAPAKPPAANAVPHKRLEDMTPEEQRRYAESQMERERQERLVRGGPRAVEAAKAPPPPPPPPMRLQSAVRPNRPAPVREAAPEPVVRMAPSVLMQELMRRYDSRFPNADRASRDAVKYTAQALFSAIPPHEIRSKTGLDPVEFLLQFRESDEYVSMKRSIKVPEGMKSSEAFERVYKPMVADAARRFMRKVAAEEEVPPPPERKMMSL